MHRLIHPSPLRSLVLAAWLVLCGSVVAASAQAATINYSFNGIVTQVGSQVSSAFANPSAMYGSMSVDTSNINNEPAFIFPGGVYIITSFQLSFSGGYRAIGAEGFSTVRVVNDGGTGNSADQFLLDAGPPNGASVGGLQPHSFSFDLEGPSNIFSSDALPTSVPSVIAFTGQDSFRLQFGASPVDDTAAVSGFLTSLTPVPLPGAVVLFGIGLLSLVGLGAGGMRSLRGPQA